MQSFLPLVLTASLLVGSALSAETFWGRCPSLGALQDFDMSKFEGLWYVVESFDPRERCKTWNIKRNIQEDNWDVFEELQSGPFHTVGLDHKSYMSGTLSQPDKNAPGKLRSYWPVSGIAGDAAFTVNTTDYVNFAGVFECQNVGIFHRQSGFVLSRTPVIQIGHRQNARIATEDIQVEYYQRVFHGSSCQYQREQEEAKKREEEERANGEEEEEENGDNGFDFVPYGYGNHGHNERNGSGPRPNIYPRPGRGEERTDVSDEATDAPMTDLLDEE